MVFSKIERLIRCLYFKLLIRSKYIMAMATFVTSVLKKDKT